MITEETSRTMGPDLRGEADGDLQAVVNNALDAVIIVDDLGRITGWNRQAEQVFGWPAAEVLLQPIESTVLPKRCNQDHLLRQACTEFTLGNAVNLRGESTANTRDGRTIPVEISIVSAQFKDSVRLTIFARDLSMRLELQEQLLQAQKMESLGRLAGGVAHDFNNLLTAIIGYAELAERKAGSNSAIQEHLKQILKAARSSADLTKQLLTLARKQPVQVQAVDLGEITSHMQKWLARIVQGDIELILTVPEECGLVMADPCQIEQLVMNLAVNARDAMPFGGRLIIKVGNAEDPELGKCVLLSVSDTGCGIPEEVRTRIFEPFYTTKPPGKGTGLGLSTCNAIVAQMGGRITVESEVGTGTTFTIAIPRAPVDQFPIVDGNESARIKTVLLVEDEPAVRQMAQEVLVEAGLKVLVAENGHHAMQLSSKHKGTIDVLISDVVMPIISGLELAELFQTCRPATKILFMSGNTPSALERVTLLRSYKFLAKPFSPRELLDKVNELLVSSPSEVAA